MIFLVAASNVEAGTTFRGINNLQHNGNGATNDFVTPVLNRAIPFHIDVFDGFGQSGAIDGTRDETGDGFQVSFVPTNESVPVGVVDSNAGIWSADSDYQASGGRLSRSSGEGSALATLPWRVTPGLGDDYLIAADVMVADGESVSLAYLGSGGGSDLDGALGQLVVELIRSGDTIDYVVDWFSAANPGGGVVRPSSSGSLSALAADLDDGVRLTLGWMDTITDQDLFDLYVSTGGGVDLRVSGSMGLAIDVDAVGLSITGTESYFDSFTAAVPEPTSAMMMVLGMLALIGLQLRRDS